MNPLIIPFLLLLAAFFVLMFFYCELKTRQRNLMNFTVDALRHQYSREDILAIIAESPAEY